MLQLLGRVPDGGDREIGVTGQDPVQYQPLQPVEEAYRHLRPPLAEVGDHLRQEHRGDRREGGHGDRARLAEQESSEFLHARTVSGDDLLGDTQGLDARRGQLHIAGVPFEELDAELPFQVRDGAAGEDWDTCISAAAAVKLAARATAVYAVSCRRVVASMADEHRAPPRPLMRLSHGQISV